MDVLMYDELRTLDKKSHMFLFVDPIVKYDNLLFAINHQNGHNGTIKAVTDSDDMIELSSLFEDADDVRATLTQMMWSNCKACHSKFRAPH